MREGDESKTESCPDDAIDVNPKNSTFAKPASLSLSAVALPMPSICSNSNVNIPQRCKVSRRWFSPLDSFFRQRAPATATNRMLHTFVHDV